MEFLKLYDEENRDILFNMSWLNKNFNFDKSTGRFENIDLFTFLENINSFNYENIGYICRGYLVAKEGTYKFFDTFDYFYSISDEVIN